MSLSISGLIRATASFSSREWAYSRQDLLFGYRLALPSSLYLSLRTKAGRSFRRLLNRGGSGRQSVRGRSLRLAVSGVTGFELLLDSSAKRTCLALVSVQVRARVVTGADLVLIVSISWRSSNICCACRFSCSARLARSASLLAFNAAESALSDAESAWIAFSWCKISCNALGCSWVVIVGDAT